MTQIDQVSSCYTHYDYFYYCRKAIAYLFIKTLICFHAFPPSQQLIYVVYSGKENMLQTLKLYITKFGGERTIISQVQQQQNKNSRPQHIRLKL